MHHCDYDDMVGYAKRVRPCDYHEMDSMSPGGSQGLMTLGKPMGMQGRMDHLGKIKNKAIFISKNTWLGFFS